MVVQIQNGSITIIVVTIPRKRAKNAPADVRTEDIARVNARDPKIGIRPPRKSPRSPARSSIAEKVQDVAKIGIERVRLLQRRLRPQRSQQLAVRLRQQLQLRLRPHQPLQQQRSQLLNRPHRQQLHQQHLQRHRPQQRNQPQLADLRHQRVQREQPPPGRVTVMRMKEEDRRTIMATQLLPVEMSVREIVRRGIIK